MAKAKDDTLVKVTMNFRKGDFEKMHALFPDEYPSVSVRNLVSAFVDKHYDSTPTDTLPVETTL